MGEADLHGRDPGSFRVTTSDAFALFLDFDGTLVEIAPRPDAVRVDPALVPVLERLRARLGGALAIVTGRPIATIDDFLAPARFDIAGLHGVERRLAGTTSGGRPEDHPDLRAGVERLKRETAPLAQVLIEDKGASVAVHWRLAAEAEAGRAQALVRTVAADLGAAYRLQLGKAVGEILPASATKGHAIRAFGAAAPYAGRRAIFLGDDKTDEIAFASVNADGGVSVRVGDEETGAQRRLASPAAVRALLTDWADGAPIDPEALPPA
ncbi:trehalose-phosphatase [Methylobacterium organophilum]|uniref:trehalose-phosphatase n=1 Tax=Methylobacterium organophilum TaxID=410 RepID=UPI003B845D95